MEDNKEREIIKLNDKQWEELVCHSFLIGEDNNEIPIKEIERTQLAPKSPVYYSVFKRLNDNKYFKVKYTIYENSCDRLPLINKEAFQVFPKEITKFIYV